MPPASGEMDVQISLLECLIPARRQGRGEEMRAVAEDAPAGPVGPIPVPALEPRLQVGGQRASRTERAQHGAPCGICEICKGFCRGKNELLELRGRGEERPAGREHLLEKREHNVKVVLRGSGQLELQEEKLGTRLQARLCSWPADVRLEHLVQLTEERERHERVDCTPGIRSATLSTSLKRRRDRSPSPAIGAM